MMPEKSVSANGTFPRRGKTRRLLVILVALCAFSSLAGGVAYFFSVYELVRQETRLHAQAAGELVRDGILAVINERVRVVDFLAEDPRLTLYFQQPDDSRLYQAEAFLDYYAGSDAGVVGYLLNSEGQVVAATNHFAPDSVIGKNAAARPYFLRSIKGGDTPSVFLGVGMLPGRRSIVVSHAVTGSGVILGVAVIEYPLNIVESRWAQLPGIMAMVGPEGQVFAASRAEWVDKPLPAAVVKPRQARAVAAPAVQGQGQEWLVTMPDGDRYMGQTFGLTGVWGLEEWRLVYLHETSDVTRKVVQGLLTPLGFALVALMLVVLAAAGVLYFRASHELQQRAAAERKVIQANAVLGQIFDVAADGLRIIDHNFTVLKANTTLAQMVGRPLAEINGRKCYEVFPGADCDTPNCPKVRIVDQGDQRLSREVVKYTADGRALSCLVVAVPFRDAAGKVVGTLESVRDISDRVATERELEKAFAEAHKLAEEVAASRDLVQKQKAKLEEAYHRLQESQAQLLQREKMASIGQLAAGVAHEINNPMGFISSNLGTMTKYTERLAEFIAAQEKGVIGCCGETSEGVAELVAQRKKLKIDYILNDVGNLIRESLEGAERVRKIVAGLKSFSRIDQAQVQPADLNECLESTINIVWNELKYKAEVKREYGELPPTVCNPQQLNQVFMNLLVNAAQAIEKQGVITVKTWADGQWVYAAVSDTGSGIPQEKLSRVFEPFYTTKEVGKGTGLGLAIAYDIVVKKHQGTIEVASEEGKGTTFTVKIPLVAKDNPPS